MFKLYVLKLKIEMSDYIKLKTYKAKHIVNIMKIVKEWEKRFKNL